jgi:Transposase
MRPHRREPKKGRGKTKSPRGRETTRRGSRGRRYSDRQRIESLKLIAAGMSRRQVAETIGATVETLRLWVKKAEAQGTMPAAMVATAAGGVPGRPALETPTEDDTEPPSPFAARDPGQGLAPAEEQAIIEEKKRHPSMGPAQIRAQLKRHKGWR